MLFLFGTEIPSAENALKMQTESLNRTFGIDGPHIFLQYLRGHGYTVDDEPAGRSYCDFLIFTCDPQGRITEWTMEEFKCRGLYLYLLPNTMTRIDWQTVQLDRTYLPTRCLPRRLEYCRMTYCQLSDEIDMRVLPRNMEFFDVSGNSFFGTVSLFDLPKNIQIVRFRDNSGLLTIMVENARLPKSLVEAKFSIRESTHKVICVDAKKPDPRIIAVYSVFDYD